VVAQDHLPALEPGDVPALGGGDGGGGVAGGARVEGGAGEVGDVVENERGVDVVGEHAAAVAVDDVGDGGELVAGEDTADRVPRVAQHEEAGGGGEGGVDGVEVEVVAAVLLEDRGHLDDLAVQGRHDGEEGHVGRRRHDDGGTG